MLDLHAAFARSSPRPSLRRITRRCGLLASVLLLGGRIALAQGTEGTFPAPRGGAEIDAWLDDAGVPEAGRDAIFEIHARYLAEVERLRDGEVEAWLRSGPLPWSSGDVAQLRSKVEEAAARIESQRRLTARLDALEERLWDEVAATTDLPDEAVGAMRARARLRRISDFGGGPMYGRARAADVAALVAAAKASRSEAARIGEALAGHDAALLRILEEQRGIALDAELRQATSQLEQAEAFEETGRLVEEEVAAAAAEGREARVQEIYARAQPLRLAGEQEMNRSRARMIRLQLDAVRAIEPIVGDPSRSAAVFAAAGIGHDEMDDFFGAFEEMGRTGELAPDKVEAVAGLKVRAIAGNLPLQMELAELMARRLELPDGGWGQLPDGTYGQSPEGKEIDERTMALQGGDAGRDQMQIIVELGRIVGTRTFAEVMRAWGTKQGMPEQMLEPMIAQLVAGIDAGAIDAQAMQQEFMRRMWSAPPAWKVIDEPMLEAILDDLAVEGEMRLVARQLIEDGAPRFAAAIEETAAEIAPPQDLDPEQLMRRSMGGASGEQLAAFDAGLRRVLAADEAFFDDLVEVLGDESADALRPWRAVRRSRLIAACDSGPMAMMMSMWMEPWRGQFGALDLFVLAEQSIPDALRDSAARAAFAASAERIAALQDERWRAIRTLQPEQAERSASSMALQEEIALAQAEDSAIGEAAMARIRESQQRMQEIEAELERWRRAVPDAVREELARLQAVLGAESARTFRRAVLLEAWRRDVGEMPGRDSIDAARARAEAAGDAAQVAELDALAATYDDALGRLLEILWATSEDLRARESRPLAGGEDAVVVDPVDTTRWWSSASGRVKFRLGEADFALARRAR